MAGAAKRHHYVPQCLLRGFCDDDGYIWFVERDGFGEYSGEIEQRRTASIFWRKYYYSIERDGKSSDVVEKKFFQRLDDRLAKLIDKYLACEDRGVLDISREEEIETAYLIFHLITRVPNFANSCFPSDTELGRQLFNEILIETDQDHPEHLDAVTALNDPDRLKKAGRNIRVQVQASPPKEALPYLHDLRAKIVRSAGKHSFIISDKPVFRLGNGGMNGLANHMSEIWLPITCKVAIVMLNKRFAGIPDFQEIGREKMRELNGYVVGNASAVGSHSKILIESLLRGRR